MQLKNQIAFSEIFKRRTILRRLFSIGRHKKPTSVISSDIDIGVGNVLFSDKKDVNSVSILCRVSRQKGREYTGYVHLKWCG